MACANTAWGDVDFSSTIITKVDDLPSEATAGDVDFSTNVFKGDGSSAALGGIGFDTEVLVGTLAECGGYVQAYCTMDDVFTDIQVDWDNIPPGYGVVMSCNGTAGPHSTEYASNGHSCYHGWPGGWWGVSYDPSGYYNLWATVVNDIGEWTVTAANAFKYTGGVLGDYEQSGYYCSNVSTITVSEYIP